jgi:hypothetical protein
MGDVRYAQNRAPLKSANFQLHWCPVNMKTITKVLALGGILALIVWAMVFISSEENSINLNRDWGIAKDHPIK